MWDLSHFLPIIYTLFSNFFLVFSSIYFRFLHSQGWLCCRRRGRRRSVRIDRRISPCSSSVVLRVSWFALFSVDSQVLGVIAYAIWRFATNFRWIFDLSPLVHLTSTHIYISAHICICIFAVNWIVWRVGVRVVNLFAIKLTDNQRRTSPPFLCVGCCFICSCSLALFPVCGEKRKGKEQRNSPKRNATLRWWIYWMKDVEGRMLGRSM